MPNSGRGRGDGRGKKVFLPLAASEWMSNQNRLYGNSPAQVANQSSVHQGKSYQAPPAQPQWSTITPTQGNYQLLLNLCHSEQQLVKAGYVRKKLSEEDLQSKLKCRRCMAKFKPRRPYPGQDDGNPDNKPRMMEGNDSKPQNPENKITQSEGPGHYLQMSKAVCFYHTGAISRNFWQCCGSHKSKSGCTGEAAHDFVAVNDPGFQQNWLYQRTPPSQPTQTNTQQQTSSPSHSRAAIALDCEMGIATSGDSELIRLTAIDFFTGEPLIDNIVKPACPMARLNTQYSGVDWRDIQDAEAKGTCFYGRDAARRALLGYVDPDTIVLAHSGINDFNALRWIHPKIVDTFLLYEERKKQEENARQLAEYMREAERLKTTVAEVQKRREAKAKADKLSRAAGAAMMEDFTRVPTQASAQPPKQKRAPGGLSLMALVKQHAGIDIQTGYGHDSLEDALACRELAIRFLRGGPHQMVDQLNNYIASSFYGHQSEFGSLKRTAAQEKACSDTTTDKDGDLLEFVGETLSNMMPNDDDLISRMLERLTFTMARRRAFC